MTDKKNKYLKAAPLLLFLTAVFFIFIKINHSHSYALNAEWKKGPLMDASSPYSLQKAPKMFLLGVVILEASFIFLSFLLYSALKKGLIRYSKLRFVIINCILLFSAFFVTEVSLRWCINKYSLTHFRPHPVLLWQVRPRLKDFVNYVDKERITTNSLGLRGQEVSFYKDKNEFRILVLGDSSNFGQGVNNNETWACRLETMLKQKFPKRGVRVINGACPGYTTFEGLAFLKTTGIRFKPDVLIVGFNNDPSKDTMEDKDRAGKNTFIITIKSILYQSDFYLLLRQTAVTISRILYDAPGRNLPEDDSRLVPRVSLEDYELNIVDFIEIAHKNNIYLIFLKMPVNMTVDGLKRRFYDSLYPKALQRICFDYKQTLVDIDSAWDCTGNNPELFIPGHLFHPNIKGHISIAQQLYEAIINAKKI